MRIHAYIFLKARMSFQITYINTLQSCRNWAAIRMTAMSRLLSIAAHHRPGTICQQLTCATVTSEWHFYGLKVPRYIHARVQNTHNQQSIGLALVEYEMGLMLESSQPMRQLLRAPAHAGIANELIETGL